MARQTQLYSQHQQLNACFSEMAGWDIPAYYSSAQEEHDAVRQGAGLFDLSHQLVIDAEGFDARRWLRLLLSRDVADLTLAGQAQRNLMLSSDGLILDQITVYRFADDHYRLIGSDADVLWMRKHIGRTASNLTLTAHRNYAMLAVIGSQSRQRLAQALPAHSARISQLMLNTGCLLDDMMIGCRQFAGEEGFELVVPTKQVQTLWGQLLRQGIKPCGLDSLETLRIEAGELAFGHELREHLTPYACGLGQWLDFSDPERVFAGRAPLEGGQDEQHILGAALPGLAVIPAGSKFVCPPLPELIPEATDEASADGATEPTPPVEPLPREGEVTSVTYSPSRQQTLVMLRVPLDIVPGESIELAGSDRTMTVLLQALPF